ncbi:hypothetical protein C8R45DRAFT_848892 [Mycena sanguinolenta]|nr:hypothetical protein C8R45DRAFT_850283 [Mycena sanguinolenta]KAJ6450680.1 hypothetical protein C8R45DRAFT_848892 [Mycena sanguinolenta]
MPLRCQKCGHSNAWDTNSVPTASTSSAPDVFEAESHRAALAEIQAEIARFKTYAACYISALEKQQEELDARLTSIVYPILSLPAEITSSIFVECLPDDGVSPSPESAPLLLLRVCRQWKDIALSTSQLWGSLCIGSISSDKILVPRGILLRLQAWFSRARERPISLAIKYEYHREMVGSLVMHLPCV